MKGSFMEILFFHAESISEVLDAAPNGLAELTALACIVKPNSKPVTKASLREFFAHEGMLSLASDGEKIVGAACLAKVFKYNGNTLRLEHVSVLPSHEGQGIARRLIERVHLWVEAEERKTYIDLTCEPFRERANNLYESMGYAIRATNSRRKCFDPGA